MQEKERFFLDFQGFGVYERAKQKPVSMITDRFGSLFSGD